MAAYRNTPPELEEEMKKSIQENPSGISPELMDYATTLFPNLKSAVLPQNYNELAQNENPLPEDYDKLAQDEALTQGPLPQDYNDLAQEDANLQDNFSEPMRLEKTPEEITKQQRQMGQAYPEPIPSTLERPKPQFEMSPELKEYGYNLFGLKDLAKDKQQQIPFAPEEEPVMEEAPKEEDISKEPVAEAMPSRKAAPTISTEPQVMPQAAPVQLKQQLPKEEELGIDQLIDQARKKEDQADLFKSIAKFRDAIMGAGSGRVIAGDYSTYEEMKAKAKRPLADQILKDELKSKKIKDDPKSDISKLMRKTLQDVGVDMTGFDNVSYSQLEKIYPSLANAISTKIAADARKEEALLNSRLRAEAKAEAKEYKESALQDKKYNELVKRTDNVLKSDEYKLYNQTKPTVALIDEAIKKWNSSDDSYKETAQAAFMGFAKSAQQDSSVVRSEDMKVLAGGLNYSNPEALLQKFWARGKGASFSPQELQEFKKVVQVISNVKKKDLQKRFDPILERAERSKIDMDVVTSPDLIDEIYSEEKIPLTDQEKKMQEFEAKMNATAARMEMLRNKKGQ